MKTREADRARANANKKRRLNEDPVFKVHALLSGRFRGWMHRMGGVKVWRTELVVGCTYKEAVAYLNNNDRGLTWGQEGVEIDHIRPQASFTSCGEVEQRELWKFHNLQLLRLIDNRQKSDHFDPVEYAASERGKIIAKLRIGWVLEFGETVEVAPAGRRRTRRQSRWWEFD
jgi:hypothetical protein